MLRCAMHATFKPENLNPFCKSRFKKIILKWMINRGSERGVWISLGHYWVSINTMKL
jgi:hypothetical protein